MSFPHTMSSHSSNHHRIVAAMDSFTQFSWEITIAIIIKFTLFGLVWWLFFAGHKIHVDEKILTQRLFGAATLSEEKVK